MSRRAFRAFFEPVRLAVRGWAYSPLPQIRLGYRAFGLAQGPIRAANDA